MSYTPPHPLPMEWSTCSYRDQIKTFKEESHRCMMSGGGGGGGGGKCKCNGNSIKSGRFQGAGACKSGWPREISCGVFCFVDKDTCRDQIHLHGLENYGYASCTPCSQTRSAEPLPTAVCPRDSSASPNLIGTGVGLLTAGNYRCAFNLFRQSIL